ncbi:MAG: cytochrome c oxidase subunit II [Betaproteobacteria bacterium]|nr:cytochrome c oxidase subunit II [Betaproteobacteria bacterium]
MSSKSVATLAGVSALALYSSMSTAAGEQSKYNLPEPQSVIAHEIYDMHIWLMWICVVIFVGVFGVMFYSILKHRKSLGYKAANFHHSTSVEIVWTVIPCIILIVMAYPATKTVISMKDTSSPDMTIKATGYQWMWGYDYLTGEGEGISFFSRLSTPRAQIENKEPKGENYLLEVDNRVVVPVGKKVRVIITANDVIHAWWVPALGIKQDAIPGFIRDTWFTVDTPGVYRGQCAELCGKDHGFMPIVVEALEEDDYAEWVAAQLGASEAAAEQAEADAEKEFTMEELNTKGEQVYAAHCAACHQPNGQGIPGAFSALDGSELVNGPVAEHIDIVINGKANTAMTPFRHLSDVDLAAVVTYERNAWSNDTGDVVQPSDINEYRN